MPVIFLLVLEHAAKVPAQMEAPKDELVHGLNPAVPAASKGRVAMDWILSAAPAALGFQVANHKGTVQTATMEMPRLQQ